jgi:hypothetical protein
VLLCLINLAFLNPQVLNWDKIFVSQFTKIKVGALPDLQASLTLFNYNLTNLSNQLKTGSLGQCHQLHDCKIKQTTAEDASTPTTKSLCKMTWEEKRKKVGLVPRPLKKKLIFF